MLKVHHLGIWVQDLDRSSWFYGQVMGFEKQYDYQIPAELVRHIFGRDTDCHVEVFRRDEVTLELFRPDEKMEDQSSLPLAPAINHFGLQVADKKTFCKQAEVQGAQVIEVQREDHCVYFIRDPQGILIEIKER